MADIITNARELRQNSTEAEKLLWSKLRSRQIADLKFKRQYAFPPYILDFFCEEHGLAVELDGGQHNEPHQQQTDSQRSAFLKEKGIRVLRFWNNDVMQNIEGVLEVIAAAVSLPASPSPKPSPEAEGFRRILIGEIATAHGIKGFVKVRSFVEDESLLESGAVYTGETSSDTISLKLKNALKGDWVAEVKGIADRNGAEALRGTQLYIDRAALPDPEDGKYYVEDLKGLNVVDKDGENIGTVLSIENFGASDLIDIKPPGGQSFYLPFTDAILLDVDFEAGIITVEMPEIV